jgi:hypothetical protein
MYNARRRNSSPPDSIFSARLSSHNAASEYRRPSGAASVIGVPTRVPSALSTEQKFNAYRSRYMASTTPYASSVASKSSDTPQSQRRASTSETPGASRLHSYRPSRLNYASMRSPEYSPQTDSRNDGADSAVSTVQSAVWDEMQELKSHVQRIEHSRRFPSSGGAGSNGSGERPRTATTTVTTISSSPKLPMKAAMSTTDSNLAPSDVANLHPLLHSALARCKPVLNPALFRALDSATSDALDMAAWSRTTGPQGSIYSSASAMNGVTGDRQLRRKADNLCRNLTDLCVTLYENHDDLPSPPGPTIAQRRQSRDVTPSMVESPIQALSRPYSRQVSVEPEDLRPATSRALDRVEARRTSLMSNPSPAQSPREATYTAASNRNSHPTGLKSSPHPASTMLRSGTSLLRSRRAATEEEDDDLARPISRAATEVGPSLRKRTDRLSTTMSRAPDRQYTSNYPLPNPNPNPHHGFRRANAAPSSSDASPTTPSLLRGTARRLFERSDRDRDHSSLQVPSDDGGGSVGAGEGEMKKKRRSFGLYAGSSGNNTTGRGLGLGRTSSLGQKRASLTAGGTN